MIQQVLNYLISCNKLPSKGAFEITESLLIDYVFAYKLLTNGKDIGTTSNIKYARRLAGINLLKENIARGAKPSSIKAGHIYIISNQAFPLHYKLGVSYDCHKRLEGYQTYSPYRDFVLEKYDFVLDKFYTEKLLLNHPLLCKEQGEWVIQENAKVIFDDIAREHLKNYIGCW